MPTTEATVDPAKVEEFAGRLLSVFTGSMLTYMIELGQRTGLFAAAAAGPATSEELADRAGLVERYVREWLGSMVTGGVVDYDPATATYSLRPERAPGLTDQLTAGARVADIACGTGHALVVLARAFPASTFVGYDLDEGAIARARAEAQGARLPNVRFEVRDAARLIVDEAFDVVFVFDAIHDQVDPAGVLRRINDALVEGGTFVMTEPRAADKLEDNMANPMAPMLFACSTLHCMT